MAHWKIRVLRANDDPRWQTIHSFWVRIFSFQIQFIRSPEIVYSILILRENWIVDYRIEKMLFKYSYYGLTGKIFAFFQKKKKKCLPTYSNFEFEKMGTKKFFYHGLIATYSYRSVHRILCQNRGNYVVIMIMTNP